MSLPLSHFEYVNSSDWGGFYEGMVPDVMANDDITRDFGDPQEASLAAAMASLRAPRPKAVPVQDAASVFS